ncbi:cytochrome b [Parvularcula lutaonensis]|uniref:Cytochrome b n=1 Tax=Parvularcula lutaonensis TaxID=491923 RepID=A0ABV7ME51_9PROT|nr:cytochrome b [Parvularcula lutaonensis]
MTDQSRYTAVAKFLHWLIALIILIQIPFGFYMHNLEPSEFKFTLYQLHKSAGLIVLALALFRLYWRLTHPIPPLPAAMPNWQKIVARFTHVAFYVLIIGIPLTGWAMVSASTLGIDTKIFFLIPVPHLPVPQGEEQVEFWIEVHELLAKATIGLLVLHVGAALKHHFHDRDDILIRMLPERLQPRMAAKPTPQKDPAE